MVEKQRRRSGNSPLKGSYEAQQVPADDSREARLTGTLNIYYYAVIACIRDAESILIFGPGEGKAEELIQQINFDAINDMKEEHRIQFEKHAQNLKKIKSEVQGMIEKKGTSEISSSAEGMHEAIQDIVKAMRDLTKYLC